MKSMALSGIAVALMLIIASDLISPIESTGDGRTILAVLLGGVGLFVWTRDEVPAAREDDSR